MAKKVKSKSRSTRSSEPSSRDRFQCKIFGFAVSALTIGAMILSLVAMRRRGIGPGAAPIAIKDTAPSLDAGVEDLALDPAVNGWKDEAVELKDAPDGSASNATLGEMMQKTAEEGRADTPSPGGAETLVEGGDARGGSDEQEGEVQNNEIPSATQHREPEATKEAYSHLNLPVPDGLESERPQTSATAHTQSQSAPGFFSDDGRKFLGVDTAVQNNRNYTWISFMVFRIIMANSIKSVADTPCLNSAAWMPSTLTAIENELLGFQYYCIETTNTRAKEMALFYDGHPLTTVMGLRPGQDAFPEVDLFFSLGYFQHISPARTWKTFMKLRQANVRWALFENHVGQSNTQALLGERGVMNVRRSPFHFDEPLRVVSNISVEGRSVVSQLVFYELSGLRKGM